jgi:hypothetical protein
MTLLHIHSLEYLVEPSVFVQLPGDEYTKESRIHGIVNTPESLESPEDSIKKTSNFTNIRPN